MPRASSLAPRTAVASLIVVGSSCLPARPATVSPLDTDRARIARFATQAESLRGVLRIPGLAVAIVRDGRLAFARGYGYADVERRVAVTDSTPFDVGSLTKIFTSTLLLSLVERGAVSLDDPIRKYTVEIPEPRAKVRQVASTTFMGEPAEASHHGALTRVLEHATGEPYRALLAREILEPLGLRHSVPGADVLDSASRYAALLGDSTLARYATVLAARAKPYRLYAGAETVQGVYPPRALSAATGLVSSVRDLATYDSALDAHVLVRRGTQQLAWSPAVADDGRTSPYGLGWYVRDYRWHRLLWNADGSPGAYSSLVLKAPAQGLTLILLANSDGLSAGFHGVGGAESNPIACEFLRIFVFEPRLGIRLVDPMWTDDSVATRASIAAAAEGSRYDYGCEWQDAQLVAEERARDARRLPAILPASLPKSP